MKTGMNRCKPHKYRIKKYEYGPAIFEIFLPTLSDQALLPCPALKETPLPHLVYILFENKDQNLLPRFPREIAFGNITKMISDCSRLQEIGFNFFKFSRGWSPTPVGGK